MKVTKISVGVSHKINLPGAYETINPSVHLEAELEEGESLEAVAKDLKKKADSLFWEMAYNDYAQALYRNTVGTPQWFQMLQQGLSSPK